MNRTALIATMTVLFSSLPNQAGADVASLPCSSTRTETWPDGSQVTRCTLSQPVEIDGVRYRDYVFADEKGRVRYSRLADEAVIEGARLPARTWVARGTDGAIEFVFLPGTTTVDGHACRGGGHDYMTRFHPNGRLRTCWLDEDEVIDGVPCRDSGFFLFGGVSTEFQTDGRLAECTLRGAWTHDGVTFGKGTRLRFDRDGRPVKKA
jgi:hypothetical protein